MSLLLAISVPAINGLKGGGDFHSAVDEVALALDRARAYAVAKNTYVWVGFYEESATGAASSTLPPFTGRGRVVVATVASVDGTRIFEDGSAAAMLPPDRLRPVGRLLKISRLHLADVGAPTGMGETGRLDGRPDLPYTGEDAEGSRISSESAARTPYPFQAGTYTFHKTIRFSPSGEATVNGESVPRRLGEIGLIPTQGDEVADSQPNVAAVQFSGLGGKVRTYRR